MAANDFLSLRLVRLKTADAWPNSGASLSLIFPKAGRGRFVAGPVDQPITVGDVLVVQQAQGGGLQARDKGELVFWSFSVCLENLFPLFATEEISLLQTVLEGFKTCKLYPASTPVAGECHRLLREVPPQFDLDHRAQLLRVVVTILSLEFKTARSHRAGFMRPEEHLVQVFEKLPANEMLTLSVAELADRFGCSRRHLSRLFRQHFGLSVAGLRMEMRLLKAVSLLRDPDAKIINVAEQCGFNHLGLFNICFKRRFGASPGQWRKTNSSAATGTRTPNGPDAGCPLRTIGLCPWKAGPETNQSAQLQTGLRAQNPAFASPGLNPKRPKPAQTDPLNRDVPGSYLSDSGITFRVQP